MKNNLKKILILFFSAMVLVSCSSPKPVLNEEKTNTITIKETLHDTVFKIEKDSSTFKALLECQNGKIILKNVIQVEPGRTLKSPKVRLDNNHLTVDCNLKEQELYAFWKSKQVKEVQLKTLNTIKYTNYLTFFQKVQIWLGRIFILVSLYYCAKSSIKFYRPFA